MYLNVFRHFKRADIDAEAYAKDAARMEELARQQQGFIDFRRYASSDGEFLSISEWESAEDAHRWSRQPEHLAMQAKSLSVYYSSYVVYSCTNPNVRRFESADA